MKCIVLGCDTDENVVSYTSVFFVKFPENPVLQNEWLNVIGITDTVLVHALQSGVVKLCSCHFTEDCFEQHPFYGYRFLIPGALPTIFPRSITDLTPANHDLPQEDGESEPKYYLICETESSGSSLQVEDEELEFKSENSSIFEEEFTNEDSLEEIGIKLVDGKYYFFQLEEQPDGNEPEPEPQPDSESEPGPEVTSNQESGNSPDPWQNLLFEEYDSSVPSYDKESELDRFIRTSSSKHNEAIHESQADTVEFEESEGIIKKLLENSQVETTDACNEDAISYESGTIVQDDGDEEVEKDDILEKTLSPEPVLEGLMQDSNYSSQNADECALDAVSNTETPEYTLETEALDEAFASSSETLVTVEKTTKDKCHVCSVCGKAFQYPSGLIKHGRVHSKEKPYSCDVCQKSFSQKINLKVHMRLHTGERPEGRFVCKVCDKKCTRQSELRVHQGTHLKNHPIGCPACPARFTNVTRLYTHLRQEHRDQEVTMDDVMKKFRKCSAPRIISDEQPVEDDVICPDGRFECVICNRRFMHARMLHRHKRKMHPKVFCCRYCKRTFPYRSHLEKHITVHTFQKKFNCLHCTATFAQRCNLNKHIQHKHSEILIVEEDIDMDDVLIEDHGDGSAKLFNCKRCNKSFFRKTTWLTHMATHKTGKDDQATCQLCHMTYASRDSLRTHYSRVHRSVEKLDGSKLCLESYPSSDAVDYHGIIDDVAMMED